MNERLKIIRKNLHKTQQEFGDICGKSRRAIAAYEQGAVIPDDSFVQLLCLKFNVNEIWLRTGIGNIYVEQKTNYINELSEQYNLNELGKQFLINFLELDETERNTMLQCMEFMLTNRKKNDDEKSYTEKMEQVLHELQVAENSKKYTVSTTTNTTNNITNEKIS